MASAAPILSDDQREQFLTRGHVVIPGCFSRDLAQRLTDRAFDRLGYDRHDPATWEQAQIHMPAMERWEVKEFAPKAWAAIIELMGGEAAIKQPCSWGDSFILNLRSGADQPWRPPSPAVTGWHKDGDWFRHFLDSPEQGLLTIILWSDIRPQSGGTFVAADSVRHVARYLLEHPEGREPNQFDFQGMATQCRDFIEITGSIGDVVLIHPFVLHASSQNPSGIPRFITNPAISFNEPMNFNRANPEEFNLVERAILRGLGVERLDFQITGQRERLIPERERRQKAMLEAETARLAALAN